MTPGIDRATRARRLQMIRNGLLYAARQVYPESAVASVARVGLGALDVTAQEMREQIAYLRESGLIEVKGVGFLGRSETLIKLTPKGLDMADGLDPQNPLGPEDAA